MMLVVANFADEDITCKVVIPSHAFDFLGIPHKAVEAEDMLGGGRMTADFKNDDFVLVNVSGHDCRIFKFNLSMDTEQGRVSSCSYSRTSPQSDDDQNVRM